MSAQPHRAWVAASDRFTKEWEELFGMDQRFLDYNRSEEDKDFGAHTYFEIP
jgi:hypothetical protein